MLELTLRHITGSSLENILGICCHSSKYYNQGDIPDTYCGICRGPSTGKQQIQQSSIAKSVGEMENGRLLC
jgi:hypothetical protein